ncbi:MAG: insulinase family protein, partial [Bacteroidales bacterium]|nr:insulinase family protein [Bacteroidales bacterium]
MKTIKFLSLISLLFLLFSACNQAYERVPGDPMNTRIYTLDNGLKVYMTVNKDEPRIQTYVAVKVGAKNDPAETTGLAHYFEHLMFKGSKQFGTMNYEMEKPLLDKIEALFEEYRTKTDEAERRALYKIIDSVSFEASKFFIPNEYDKLMTAIGASGTNAYTGFDMTVYTEDIPSNQIENWAKIQADRFQNNVIRGFHTELETVYEEKNMSLTNDFRKVYERILATLFPHHPYGTQTVLGTQEHLKNPSVTNIKNYYKTYYVPNNMAICLSGDFNPKEMIQVIKKYFGEMKPAASIPELEFKEAKALTEPVVCEVYGNDAENITLGWSCVGIGDEEFNLLTLTDMIMNNGKAGLIDLDLIQQQKVLNAFSGAYEMADHSAYIIQGRPKEGQSLEEVKDLLLKEIAKLKAGDFDDFLLEASINNLKLTRIRDMQSNNGRADMYVRAFINEVDWADEVKRMDDLGKISKEDVVAFANKWFNDGYALVYKRQGPDPNERKIAKPEITPILTNRDTASVFLKEIQQAMVKPIQPVFLDFKKDFSRFTAQAEIPVLFIQNQADDLFELTYWFDMGTNSNNLLSLAFNYLNYLGTSEYSAEEIKSEFYKMACSFNLSAGSEKAHIRLTGLGENMPEALNLLEKLLADAQVNQQAFDNMIQDILKDRANAKLSQSRIFSMLRNYAVYGPKSPATNVLSNQELLNLKPEALIDVLGKMTSYQHKVLYYGPDSKEELTAVLNEKHQLPETLLELPAAKEFPYLQTKDNQVLFAQYNAKQLYLSMYSNSGELFDLEKEPLTTLYNEYFGGSMNSIVFQEMREARGLAYSAAAAYVTPSRAGRPYSMVSIIATQTDKMDDALQAFYQIIEDMPESEAAFKLAKDGLFSRLRTERILRSNILWTYLDALDYGIEEDSRKYLFESLVDLDLEDLKAFQQEWIKNRSYSYCVLGDEKEVDFKRLA